MGSTHLTLFSTPLSLLTTPTNFHPKFRCRFSFRPKWDLDPVRATPFDFDREFSFPRRRKRVKRRNWWSDDDDDDDEDCEEEGYDRGGFGLWAEPISFGWVFEVLKSFGWMIPAVIMSALMGTEPDHSLIMALALPLGQTALSLVFEGLWGRNSRNRKPGSRSRTKPKPRPRSERNSFARNPRGAQPRKNSRGRGTQTGREGYCSWEAANIGSAKKGAKSESRFGGWDELLDEPAGRSKNFSKD